MLFPSQLVISTPLNGTKLVTMNQSEKLKLAVVIPVFNEEESLPQVLKDIPADLVDEVVVVDNGSTDGSAELAMAAGATVLSESHRGYGAACLKGIEYLKSNPPDVLVFLDGDYSDYPEEISALLAKYREGYDFVLGSRVLGMDAFGAQLSKHSVMGNKLAAFFLRLLFGGNYTDLGPFRLIGFRQLLSLGMADRNYGWTMEMQIKALRKNLRICEIPVHYRDRFGGESKVTGTFLGSVKAFAKITITVIAYFLRLKQ